MTGVYVLLGGILLLMWTIGLLVYLSDRQANQKKLKKKD